MNKIIITICALCLSLMATAQVNYTIKGIANSMNGKTVYLYAAEDELDSATVSNNSFTFKGTQPKIYIATIMLDRMGIPVILENGTINISFDNPENYIYPGKVTGTPTNDIFCAYNTKISALQLKISALSMQKSKLKEEQKEEKEVLKKKSKKIMDTIDSIAKEYLNQNLDNIVGAYILKWIENTMSDEEFAKILADASPAMKENYITEATIEYRAAIKHTAIGKKFIDFKLKDPNDKEIALSDYVGKGKYVLLEFWASWCGPCRGEVPYLKSAYEKFKSKGFEIVGVSVDDSKKDWLKGIKDLGITWPQMSDLKGWKCEGAKIYGIRGIPSTLLIDPNGIIIAKDLRGEALEKKLSEIFK